MNYVTYDSRQHDAVKDLFPRWQQEKSTKESLAHGLWNKNRDSSGTLTASICSLDNIGKVLLIEGLMLLSIHAPMAPDPIWCIRTA